MQSGNEDEIEEFAGRFFVFFRNVTRPLLRGLELTRDSISYEDSTHYVCGVPGLEVPAEDELLPSARKQNRFRNPLVFEILI